MSYWLLKTEPEDYSFADLERDGGTIWDGVTSAPGLKNIRPVTLAEVKADPAFADFDLVRVPRLSVMPVPPAFWRLLLSLAGM